MANIKRVFTAVPDAVSTVGFWKAFVYSFVSWLVAWGLAYLALPEAVSSLGRWGWCVPVLNSLLVFAKQYLDALTVEKST